MRILTIMMATVFLIACGDDADNDSGSNDALTCDWGEAQLVPGTAPQEPVGQDGPLEDALIGQWQHTFIVLSDGTVEANEEGTDLRYVFGPEQMAFCQDVQALPEPSRNVSSYTIEGDTINAGATFTALTWSEDIMVWNNDTLGDQQYILQRRK